jgi:hypothetical protein
LANKSHSVAEFRNFRSRAHTIETGNFKKNLLSPKYDKKFVLADGITILAHFNYRISDPEFIKSEIKQIIGKSFCVRRLCQFVYLPFLFIVVFVMSVPLLTALVDCRLC